MWQLLVHVEMCTKYVSDFKLKECKIRGDKYKILIHVYVD